MSSFVLRRLAAPAGLSIALLSTVPAQATVATASQAFVDRIGVNVHLDFYSSAYDDFDRAHQNPLPDMVGFQNVETALRYLGIKHVRDSPNDPYFLSLYPQMNTDLGVKFDFYIGSGLFPNDPTGTNTGTIKINVLTSIGAITSVTGRR